MISDAIAWFVILAGVMIAIVFPIVAPVHASYQRLIGEQPVSCLFTVSTVVMALFSALGAYQLSRRKPQGLLLIMLSCLLWMGTGHIHAALVYGCLVLMIFGTPLLLSYLEARKLGRGR